MIYVGINYQNAVIISLSDCVRPGMVMLQISLVNLCGCYKFLDFLAIVVKHSFCLVLNKQGQFEMARRSPILQHEVNKR